MDRVRWSDKAIPFRNLVDNPAIQKPALVQIGNKAIIVGEKINGEFIMASPCKVCGDRFDVMEQEIILSSKHSGVWRVISKAKSKKEGHIHRLTTKDLETIHKNDIRNERQARRSYICIRDIEAFDLLIHHDDPNIVNGNRIDRRIKEIQENTEFEIDDAGEVEYTPTSGERTSQDYTLVPKSKQSRILQLFLPGAIEQEKVVRNRVIRALHCTTKGEARKRHFLLEVSEQPCEIRPIASEGSIELRYLHSTKNLYDYMVTYGNDTIIYVKLLRGDPPIKAIEFDGYLVLKSILNGDKIPICRVEDLEITLVSPDLPVKIRLPTQNETIWRSSSEVRAAEVQCMQLALSLLARHESEMYVTREEEKNTTNYLQTNYNQDLRINNFHQSSQAMKKHVEECEKIFGNINNQSSTQIKSINNNRLHPSQSVERQSKNLTHHHKNLIDKSSLGSKEESIKTSIHKSHVASDNLYRIAAKELTNNKQQQQQQQDSSNRLNPKEMSIHSSSSNFRTKTNIK